MMIIIIDLPVLYTMVVFTSLAESSIKMERFGIMMECKQDLTVNMNLIYKLLHLNCYKQLLVTGKKVL